MHSTQIIAWSLFSDDHYLSSSSIVIVFLGTQGIAYARILSKTQLSNSVGQAEEMDKHHFNSGPYQRSWPKMLPIDFPPQMLPDGLYFYLF